MKKNLDLHLSHEDLMCLQALWKWKLLSTAALNLAAYKNRSAEGTYRRLMKLAKMKVIRATAANTGDSYIWLLESLGFELVLKMLPELSEIGYKSENKEHDFWVTAIHLGEWLRQVPPNCDLFSEQQLRRVSFDQYPEWVPRTNEHRCDGWWKINLGQPSSKSLIALEVELSRKSPIEYKSAGEFYSVSVLPLQVIWIVRNESDIEYIHRHLISGSKSGCEEQSFIPLSYYSKFQWQSKIVRGKNQGLTLAEILNTSHTQSLPHGVSSALLDTRKKPIKSVSLASFRLLEDGRSSSYLF